MKLFGRCVCISGTGQFRSEGPCVVAAKPFHSPRCTRFPNTRPAESRKDRGLNPGVAETFGHPGCLRSGNRDKVSTAMDARVLIVDDDPDIHALLLSSLRDMGCQADSASSGEQALALLQSNEYDLVLSDIMMPGIDGL